MRQTPLLYDRDRIWAAPRLLTHHIFPVYKSGSRTAFGKPLQFIVMGVMVVINATFSYTYKDFLHDGKLVVSNGSVTLGAIDKRLR